MTDAATSLSTVGNVVDDDYRHIAKRITPARSLILPDAYLKWYDLCGQDQHIDEAIDARAREFLAAETATGRLPISGDLGFVINHLSGEHIYLLLVFTWRGNNEMWETAYYQDVRTDQPFQLIPQGTHRGTICVWEFGAVAHEHRAWTKYLYSARDEAAKRAYADTQYAGLI